MKKKKIRFGKLNSQGLMKPMAITFLMNDINEDGGTPGFDEAAGFTLTLSEPSESLPLWRPSKIFFEIDEFCRSRRYI